MNYKTESGSRFHSLGAEAWNAREPISVQLKDMYTMIADNEAGYSELEVHEDK